MKSLLAFACLAAVATALPVFKTSSETLAHKPLFEAKIYERHFEHFVEQFENKYESKEDRAKRFEVFMSNFDFVHNWNAHKLNSTGVTVAINEFADLTHEEFKSFYLGYKPTARIQARIDAPLYADCTCQRYGPGVAQGASDYCEDFQINNCFKYTFGCGVIPGSRHCKATPGPAPPTPPPSPTPPTPTPPTPTPRPPPAVREAAVFRRRRRRSPSTP